jgi:hypothetical protein
MEPRERFVVLPSALAAVGDRVEGLVDSGDPSDHLS